MRNKTSLTHPTRQLSSEKICSLSRTHHVWHERINIHILILNIGLIDVSNNGLNENPRNRKSLKSKFIERLNNQQFAEIIERFVIFRNKAINYDALEFRAFYGRR